MNKDGIAKLIINLYAIQRVYRRARAKITEGAKVCFYKLFIKLFSFVNRSYLLLMCGWGWRGSGWYRCCCWGALTVAAAAV